MSLYEKSFLGSKMIIDEHLSPRIASKPNLIQEVTVSLKVVTKREIYLDLEKDLHFGKEKCYITNVEGYSNMKGKPYLRKFDSGSTTEFKFKVTGAVAKFPKITRYEKDGLEIMLNY